MAKKANRKTNESDVAASSEGGDNMLKKRTKAATKDEKNAADRTPCAVAALEPGEKDSKKSTKKKRMSPVAKLGDIVSDDMATISEPPLVATMTAASLDTVNTNALSSDSGDLATKKAANASNASESQGPMNYSSIVTRPGAIAVPGMNSHGGSGISVDDEGVDRSGHRGKELDIENGDSPLPIEATLVEEGQGSQQEVDRDKIAQEIRDELLNKAVVGEAMAVDDVDSSSHARKRWIICFVVALLIIVVVVAAVVGTKRETGTKEGSSTSPPSPPVSSPTPSPTTSPEPTWSPTASIENLDNGKLEEAHHLVLRGTPLENTGLNFQLQEFAGTSAACDLRRELATWFAQTDGLWYIYRSRITGPVTAILCGANSYEMDLFSEGIHFVCSTMYNGDLGNCGGTSVSWIAQKGSSYYILVRPSYDVPRLDENFSIDLVDNDRCQHAFGPVIPTSAGAVMEYSTVNAEIDPEEGGSCGGAQAGENPGVWYLVEGSGRPVTASTCSDGTTFDTQVSVFGGNCGSLTCLNGNNDSCGQASSVTWPTQVGEIYYVLVQGSDGAVGDFKLTLSTDADRTENDFCATAELLVDTIEFTFSGSTSDDVPVCSDTDSSPSAQQENVPYGLWYKLTGDGNSSAFTVSMPDEAPVEMKVLTGSCGDLRCVENLEGIGYGVVGYSEQGFLFPTAVNQTYYIFLATRERADVDVSHTISVQAWD